MRFFRTLAAAVIVAVISVNSVAAAPDYDKAMQGKKEKIQSLLKEGKITQERADELNSEIDAKIRKAKEFDGLTVEQKRAKILERFKASIDKKVSEGKLTREKGDELLKRFTEKVNAWDGTGKPHFFKKDHKGKDNDGKGCGEKVNKEKENKAQETKVKDNKGGKTE